MTKLFKGINKEHEGEKTSNVAQDRGNCWTALNVYVAVSNITLVHGHEYAWCHIAE